MIPAGSMFKFNTLGYARSFANRAHKPMAVLLGDDGLFWVVTLGKAAALLRQGYELA